MNFMKFTLTEVLLIVAASVAASMVGNLWIALAMAIVLGLVLEPVERWSRRFTQPRNHAHRRHS